MEFIDIDIGDDERDEIIRKYKKLIMEPYEYLNSYCGRKVERQIGDICIHWFNVTKEEMHIIYNIFCKIQNFVLLIDDIQDNSYKRRGVPAAHIIYGRARTIVSANNLLNTILFEDVPRHLQIPVQSWVILLLVRCMKGQIMDTYWRDKSICPSEEAYIDMVCKKTGIAFQLIFKIAMEFSGKKDKDFDQFCDAVTIYFQIMDDYCNLKSEKYLKKKGFCEDITEGKFSYPIVCALRNHPEDRRIVEILKMQTTDDLIKRECLELIENYGGFEDTTNKLSTLRKQISDEIDKLGGHQIKNLWMQILDFQLQ